MYKIQARNSIPRIRFHIAAAAVLFVSFAAASHAAIVGYTDPVAFFAAVGGSQKTVDFESTAGGTVLSDPAEFGDLSLSFTPGDGSDVELFVTDFLSQTTPGGLNSLGVNSGDEAFLSGDVIDFGFDNPITAFGLYVIGSPGDVIADDFGLTLGDTTLFNAGLPLTTLADGGEVFFLGLIDDAPAGHSSARLESFDPTNEGLFLFNVDDITYVEAQEAVPVPALNPASIPLLLGLMSFVGVGTRRQAL